MSIDYQQILMDMNRPRRRVGSGSKRWITLLVFVLIVVGAAFAVWRFGLVSALIAKVQTVAAAVLTREDPVPASGVDIGVLAAAPQAGASVAAPIPQAAPAAPIQPNGPVDVAMASNSAPSRPVSAPTAAPAAPVAVPVAQAAPQQRQGTLRPQGSPAMGPPPVLSEARAQIRAADQILADNPAEALRRLQSVMELRPQPDDAAEAGYRMGYAARLMRDEEKAEKYWGETAEKHPNSRGGRFSALALADTWYRQYAGERPQVSRWDDIQSMYSRVLGKDDAPFLPENVKAQVKANLTRLNESIIFGSAPTKLARYHKVEHGELLGSIGNRYRVDYESIARVNGINPNRIRAGMDLKVVVGDVDIVVRKNTAIPEKGPTVTWYLDGRWIKEYQACVGDGNKTPAGTYSLTSKERDPSWTNPLNGQLLSNDHPDNILGSRWMAMKGMNTQGLGIHGTTVDDSVPGYTSAGCVRLLNRDVEELFSYARIGNSVTVLE